MLPLWTFLMKCLIISSVTMKSAITPSLNGLIALIFPGVLPSIVFASSPTAKTFFFPFWSTIATTEGSFKTTPCPFKTTSVFAVPRSIAISWLQIFLILLNIPIYIPLTFWFSCSIGAVLSRLIIILFNAFI